MDALFMHIVFNLSTKVYVFIQIKKKKNSIFSFAF